MLYIYMCELLHGLERAKRLIITSRDSIHTTNYVILRNDYINQQYINQKRRESPAYITPAPPEGRPDRSVRLRWAYLQSGVLETDVNRGEDTEGRVHDWSS